MGCAGLVPYGDWIIGWAGGVLNNENDFYDVVEGVRFFLSPVSLKMVGLKRVFFCLGLSTARRYAPSAVCLQCRFRVGSSCFFLVFYSWVHIERLRTEPISFTALLSTLREVVLVPNRQWGGEGLLGCGVGYGLLHRIPKPQDQVGGRGLDVKGSTG